MRMKLSDERNCCWIVGDARLNAARPSSRWKAASCCSTTARTAVRSAALDAADRTAVRAVVEQQLAAFQRDDGRAAFSLASPTIQQQFRSSDNFMRMVRTGYQPVYRPRDVQFGAIATVN